MTQQLPKASDALVWMKCHGSHASQLLHPGPPGELSQSKLEGRACHSVAQQLFRNEPFSDIVGSLSQDGIVITQELFEAAREYYNDVWGYCNKHGLTGKWHIEQHLDLSEWHEGWFAIPDAWVYDATTGTLVIWDMKAGHSLVEVYEHWPMIIYAMGLCKELKPDVIEMRIVQPRGFHSDGTVRKWAITFDELMSYSGDVLDTLEQVLGTSPICTPGPQCKNCTARAHCDALQRTGYDNIDYVMQLQTHTLSGHSLGVELKLLQRAQEMIKMRLSGLEEQALHEIKQGQHVTFYSAKPTYGRKRWKKEIPVEQVIMMGDLMGHNLKKDVELISPSQCTKLGLDSSVISAYSETPFTGVKLELSDEKVIRQVFENAKNYTG